MANKEIKFTEKVVNWLSKWVSRLILAVLSVAGLIHLLGGVQEMIAWPVAIVLTTLLIKETL